MRIYGKLIAKHLADNLAIYPEGRTHPLKGMRALFDENKKATQFNERTQMAECPAGRTAFRISALLKVEMPKCASPKKDIKKSAPKEGTDLDFDILLIFKTQIIHVNVKFFFIICIITFFTKRNNIPSIIFKTF